MKDPIQEMRDKLSRRFFSKPVRFRVTADDSPRLPQSNIQNPREKYDRPGRPQGG